MKINFVIKKPYDSMSIWDIYVDVRISNYQPDNGCGVNIYLPLNSTTSEWDVFKDHWNAMGCRGRWIVFKLQEIVGIDHVRIWPYHLQVTISEACRFDDIYDLVKPILGQSQSIKIGNDNPTEFELKMTGFLYADKSEEEIVSSGVKDLIVDLLPSEK